MQQPTLVVLAAGLGSRYGSLKQMQAVGPSGEAILDYSVYDAIEAGFGRVVFVINPAMERDFAEELTSRFRGRVDVDFAVQRLEDLPAPFSVPDQRVKPWGTVHAVLAAETRVHTPFCVINADDFYGRQAYEAMQHFLVNHASNTNYAMAGYYLGNTLSEHGSVSRGVCLLDGQGYLKTVTEHKKIFIEDGTIVSEDDQGNKRLLAFQTPVSMNFWGFHPSVFPQFRALFYRFLQNHGKDLKKECFLPDEVDMLIQQDKVQVSVLACEAEWFGITYRQDLPRVQQALLEKIENAEYPRDLWNRQ